MGGFPYPSAAPPFVWSVALSVVGVALVACALAYIRLAWASREALGWWFLPLGVLVAADLVVGRQVIGLGWQVYLSAALGAPSFPSSRLCLGGAASLLVDGASIAIGQSGAVGLAIAPALLALNWHLARSLVRGASPGQSASPRRVRLAWLGFAVAIALEVAWCVGIVEVGGGFGDIPWLSLGVYMVLALAVAVCVVATPRPVVGWRVPRRAVAGVLVVAFVLACLGGLVAWSVATPDTVSVLVVLDGSGTPTYPPPAGDTQRQVYARTFTDSAVVVQTRAVVDSVSLSPPGAVYHCPSLEYDPTPVYALAFSHDGIPVDTAVFIPNNCSFVYEDGYSSRCCALDATWQALFDATGASPPSSYSSLRR